MNGVLLAPPAIPFVLKLPLHRFSVFMRRVIRMLTIGTSQPYDIIAEFSLGHIVCFRIQEITLIIKTLFVLNP